MHGIYHTPHTLALLADLAAELSQERCIPETRCLCGGTRKMFENRFGKPPPPLFYKGSCICLHFLNFITIQKNTQTVLSFPTNKQGLHFFHLTESQETTRYQTCLPTNNNSGSIFSLLTKVQWVKYLSTHLTMLLYLCRFSPPSYRDWETDRKSVV